MLAQRGLAASTTQSAPPRARSSGTLAQVPRPPIDDSAIEPRLDALLKSLSVEEKVGQIVQADIGSVTAEDVRKYRLGSVLNGGNSPPRRQ